MHIHIPQNHGHKVHIKKNIHVHAQEISHTHTQTKYISLLNVILNQR